MVCKLKHLGNKKDGRLKTLRFNKKIWRACGKGAVLFGFITGTTEEEITEKFDILKTEYTNLRWL